MMMKKLLEGAVFGLGFGLAVVGVAYGAFVLLVAPAMHAIPESGVQAVLVDPGERTARPAAAAEADAQTQASMSRPFEELALDDQIQQASAILVAKYEAGADGRMKAVVSEVLKPAEGGPFRYRVGDEYAPSSYYPKEGEARGDGVVVFFADRPARMVLAMTYSGDRVGGLGDVPMAVLRQKCRAS